MSPAHLRLGLTLLALVPISPRPAIAFHLFSKEDQRVKAANEAYSAGRYDEALRGYEEALRDHPTAPELQFDRGNALFKLGRQTEAREAYLSALGAKDSSLKSQDYYNMGNALWELEKKDEAAEAYERALMLDPSFDDARHNLELLLAPPPDGGQPDGGGQDGGGADGGGDGGQSKGQGDGGQGNQSQDGGGQRSQGEDGGATPKPQPEGDAGQQQPQQPKNGGQDGGGAKPQPLDKLQADQLLDALRQREKNLQMWKFRVKPQHSKEAEKDW